MQEKKVKILLLAVPIAGHFFSMLELAKRLHKLKPQQFSITILITPIYGFSIDDLSSFITSSASDLDIHFEFFPEADPPPNASSLSPALVVTRHIERYKPQVKAFMATHVPAVLIVDFLATSMIEDAEEFGVPAYVYCTSGASFLGVMLYLPTLETEFQFDRMEDVPVDIKFPGFDTPLPPLSVPDSAMDKNKPSYDNMVTHGRRFLQAKGIITNTFQEIQPKVLDALQKNFFSSNQIIRVTPPVYPVGPLLQHRAVGGPKKHECIDWLDQQPPESVVFLCFGSNGSFSSAQMAEIALGLERSGHRFLWSARRKSNSTFGYLKDANLDEDLPDGFKERTKGKGLVWPSSVPQMEILAHRSTGAFVTHCGWNSLLEGVWFGVPMVGWPLYAEQHLNAFEMDKEMGVAVELEVNRMKGNWAGKEEVEKKIRCVMDKESEVRKKVRRNVKEMMKKAREAMEDGGSSLVCMQRLGDELAIGSGGLILPTNGRT